MTRPVELDLGLVVAGHGRHYIVETPEGHRLICHPRGKKSALVVGDRVRWLPVGGDQDEGVIEHLEPRRNLLFRQDEWKTKSFAANLDQLLIWLAVDPQFSESQLTRALIAAESAGIDATIVLNKTDLPDAAAQRARLAPYRAMGYAVIELSLKHAFDAASGTLNERLAGRTTLVLGPSGTGKSTLINALLPGARAQVGEISQALNSGRHTTTTTQWYWLDRATNSALIDSPGFQEFGLQQIEAQQLPAYMPDLRAHAGGCKFYNCTHRHEPGCAVIAAVERGDVSASRWRIYGDLLDERARTRW
ncbi:ribosome small subunit-dependent GTPase A [Methylibium petroleiphilum]|uniref:Small ribosomal subunit biogenesis GTPase RsgA n=1 Tax=Methylibium petroleiphilum (strain ATCC BAA-1232 / LMG 22953 / PM1) TaxID=420662 RepID=A2SJX8_METPP|nr:ribosome small subunit-dependent GTPase A [Methylibium petroleiphilum]ABM95867.1 putative ATP/GTP-binding protein [Methylibium petroleiphilum PM1]